MSTSLTAELQPFFTLLESALTALERLFNSIPGSRVLARYVKSSHQNDPGRTVLEVILLLFAIVTIFQSRTRSDASGKHFVKYTEEEIDELVDEWAPEPLLNEMDDDAAAELGSVPVIVGAPGTRPVLQATGQPAWNLASFNFAGLMGNERVKERAIETLRKYGLGSCGPPGFYGTFDVHMDLERDIANFLRTEASIIYSQAFSTVSSVIPAFCKRGDIIVADAGVNFAIRKGIQNSRSTVRWYAHNDMKSLEDALVAVERDRRKKKGKLTRRFIVTEGIFDLDGAMADLPRLVELKIKHKFRLILDETFSFGSIGATGRGLTEYLGVPATQVDMLVGSLAHSLCATGGFCAGSKVMVEHQRINSTSVVFSAAMPPLLAVCASVGISILETSPSTFLILRDNIAAARAVLGKMDEIEIPSHSMSPVIHIRIRNSASAPSLLGHSRPNGVEKHIPSKELPVIASNMRDEKILQAVVEEAMAHGVLITRARRLRGQESPEPRPSIRLAISAAMTRQEVENAVYVVRDALTTVIAREQ